MIATSCDNYFQFEDGDPVHNDFNFCPYCGKQICSPNTTNVKQLIPVPNTIGWGEEDGFTKETK